MRNYNFFLNCNFFLKKILFSTKYCTNNLPLKNFKKIPTIHNKHIKYLHSIYFILTIDILKYNDNQIL